MLESTFPNYCDTQFQYQLGDMLSGGEFHTELRNDNLVNSQVQYAASLPSQQPEYELPQVSGELPIELWYPCENLSKHESEYLNDSTSLPYRNDCNTSVSSSLASEDSYRLHGNFVPKQLEPSYKIMMQHNTPLLPLWHSTPDSIPASSNRDLFAHTSIIERNKSQRSEMNQGDEIMDCAPSYSGKLADLYDQNKGVNYTRAKTPTFLFGSSEFDNCSRQESPIDHKDQSMGVKLTRKRHCNSLTLPSPPHSTRTFSESGSDNNCDDLLLYKCTHCNACFRIRGYLTRHMKKHEKTMKFNCPFFSKLNEEDKCHQTGGFSRRDTFKMHMKARHFGYPHKITRKERANCPGRCLGCGETFENNEVWIESHIITGQCSLNLNQGQAYLLD